MTNGRGAEADFFRGLARQGFAGGRPGNTQQGFYCFTANGVLLGSDNTRDPRRAARLLTLSLTRWRALPRESRLPAETRSASGSGRLRAEIYYPADGLVLRQYTRDLGVNRRVLGDLTTPYNSDMVWFTASEARQLLPKRLDLGASHPVPDGLVRRLARLHLLDSTLGQPAAWTDRQIEKANLTAEIQDVSGPIVKVHFRGNSRAAEAERGIELTLRGRATFDQKTTRFIEFNLVAHGTRWGRNRFRQHGDHPGPGQIGIAFVLATATEVDRAAPNFFWAYGWGR